MERRTLRRAADQALMTALRRPLADVAPLQQRITVVAPAGEDSGLDQRSEARDDSDKWTDREPVTDPISVGAIYDLLEHQPDDHMPAAPDAVRSDGASTPLLALSSPVTSEISVWTSDYRSPPWFRTKRAVIALATVAVAAIVCGALLVLRSTGTDVGEATTGGPTAEPTPSSAQPAPSSVKPTQVSSPQPPAALPPPPAPPPAQSERPVVAREYREYPAPRRAAPSPTKKPEIGVTRAPATRAPISVAPEPRQPPGNNSATPGDAPERGGGGWGWGW